jgi:hypothetical protein
MEAAIGITFIIKAALFLFSVVYFFIFMSDN